MTLNIAIYNADVYLYVDGNLVLVILKKRDGFSATIGFTEVLVRNAIHRPQKFYVTCSCADYTVIIKSETRYFGNQMSERDENLHECIE